MSKHHTDGATVDMSDTLKVGVIVRGHYEAMWSLDNNLEQSPKDRDMGLGEPVSEMEAEMAFRQMQDKHANRKVLNSWGHKARNVDEIKDLIPPALYDIMMTCGSM